MTGDQKNTVFGPASCSQIGRNFIGTNGSILRITDRYMNDILEIFFVILSLIVMRNNTGWLQNKVELFDDA